jgi:hypothetical protein
VLFEPRYFPWLDDQMNIDIPNAGKKHLFVTYPTSLNTIAMVNHKKLYINHFVRFKSQ